MHGEWIILIELLFVFAVVFGWGWNELRGLRQYRENGRDKARFKGRNEDRDQHPDRPGNPPRADHGDPGRGKQHDCPAQPAPGQSDGNSPES